MQLASSLFHTLWKPKQNLADMISEAELQKPEVAKLQGLSIPTLVFANMLQSKVSELHYIFIKLSVDKRREVNPKRVKTALEYNSGAL